MEARDLTKEMKRTKKKSIRQTRSECEHRRWDETRNGSLRCAACGTYFPCRNLCEHLDCAEEHGELEIIAELLAISVIDGDSGKVLFDYEEDAA